jgi:hypothetical protein
MSYLDGMVAHSIAEERARDTLLTLRRRELAARRTDATTAPVVPPRPHGRWHDTLAHLHLRTRTP